MSDTSRARPGRVASESRSDRTVHHPVLAASIAVVALLASWVLAQRRPVPRWELSLTEAINGAPDVVATGLYGPMQLGTVWAPVAVAVVALVWRRDVAVAVAVAFAGLAAWFLAKGVKRVVERGRPLEYVPGLEVREGSGTGLGFVSGHSAVAAATAVVAMALLPQRARPVALALAAVVGIARIVHGVHLPADVVGGWALGALVGLAALEVVDRRRAAEAGA